MPKFCKKPVVITAEQWFPDLSISGVHWGMRSNDEGQFLEPYVFTAHDQKVFLSPGDWVVPEPMEGRYYPIKPDIFADIYEPVTQEP